METNKARAGAKQSPPLANPLMGLHSWKQASSVSARMSVAPGKLARFKQPRVYCMSVIKDVKNRN